MHGDDDNLPTTVQLICSSVNGCAYCTSHQSSSVQSPKADVQATGLTDAQVADLLSGNNVGSNPVERACYAFVRAASFDPGPVSRDMLQELKALLAPGQIIQLAAIVGKWKMVNLCTSRLRTVN
jgi:alkylhydroperoxidase family enzyme